MVEKKYDGAMPVRFAARYEGDWAMELLAHAVVGGMAEVVLMKGAGLAGGQSPLFNGSSKASSFMATFPSLGWSTLKLATSALSWSSGESMRDPRGKPTLGLPG